MSHARALVTVLLAGCARASSPSPSPPSTVREPVLLNHLYTTLDAETAAAAAGSTFLDGELATVEKRTTSNAHETYTGLYVYGRRTYLELFGPGGAGSSPGASGVGLSVESVGGLDRVANDARASGRPMELDLQSMVKDGGSVPWYRLGGVATWPEDAPFQLWVMEVVPSFMAQRLAPVQVARDDVRRETYLSKIYRPERLMRDVRGVTILVSVADRDRFADAMTAYGWRMKREGEDAVAEGPDATIRLRADAHRRGVVEVNVSLAHAVASRAVPIGRSVFTLGPGAEATWRIEPAEIP